MHSRLLGGILLITGTSIGAGMLGLPIAAARLGFMGSCILLVVCWFLMVICAFLILEVNLWLPQQNNIISMAKATIGPIGQVISWAAYLLLLYSLLCAYIVGGSDLFHVLLTMLGLDIPLWISSIFFTIIFGSIVYSGMSSVDKANRALMIIKFSTFFLMIFLLVPFMTMDKLGAGNLRYITSASAITVTAASFGWATLIPSLRVYFADDVRTIKRAIIIGSLIPLFCYIIWDATIMGLIPLEGDNSLFHILQAKNTTSSLVTTLASTVNKGSISLVIKLFTSVCVLTSFLGVALCLADFLADGLNLEKKGRNKIILHAITFLPALGIAIFFPDVFIKALEYAGIYVAVLLIFMPAWMAWCGRYRTKIAKGFRVFGGKATLSLILISGFMLILWGFLH